jgi:ubiquinone/menaquinone biosynthesis C-methylase UbiE
MKTDYDMISAEYKKAKQHPWRLHIEHFTLFELIGPLAGKTVLDLACGEGFYTRSLKQKGAAAVVGVDLSAGMIRLAREQEAQRPLGIDYQVGDARKLDFDNKFDLVVAGYLLNYASTRDELVEMCQGIVRSLTPGGRFVTVNNNPNHAPECFPLTREYAFLKSTPGELEEGAPVIWKFFLDEGPFEITNYHLSIATHEWAFRTAGFGSVHWHEPQLSPAGRAEHGSEFWAPFLKHPPIIFIECQK